MLNLPTICLRFEADEDVERMRLWYRLDHQSEVGPVTLHSADAEALFVLWERAAEIIRRADDCDVEAERADSSTADATPRHTDPFALRPKRPT